MFNGWEIEVRRCRKMTEKNIRMMYEAIARIIAAREGVTVKVTQVRKKEKAA